MPEAAGGSGGTLADALAVLRIAGRHAAAVPLAETGVLGGWLLAGRRAEIPDGAVTVVPEHDPTTTSPARRRAPRHRAPGAVGAAADVIVALLDTDEGPVVVRRSADGASSRR